jgi:hypothetical protein
MCPKQYESMLFLKWTYLGVVEQPASDVCGAAKMSAWNRCIVPGRRSVAVVVTASVLAFASAW